MRVMVIVKGQPTLQRAGALPSEKLLNRHGQIQRGAWRKAGHSMLARPKGLRAELEGRGARESFRDRKAEPWWTGPFH